MTDSETVNEICALLKLLPGVAIVSKRVTSAILEITFVVEKIESIGPLAYASEGANVALHLWSEAPNAPLEAHSNPAHVRFRLMAKNYALQQSCAGENFRNFGVRLLNYLREIKAVEASEASRLCALWSG